MYRNPPPRCAPHTSELSILRYQPHPQAAKDRILSDNSSLRRKRKSSARWPEVKAFMKSLQRVWPPVSTEASVTRFLSASPWLALIPLSPLLRRYQESDHLPVVWRVAKTAPGWDEAKRRYQRSSAWRSRYGQEPAAQVRGKGAFLNFFPRSTSVPLIRHNRPLPETHSMNAIGCSDCCVHVW